MLGADFDSSGISALFFVVVLCVALLGGVVPAALSALISGFLLNYFFTEPRYSLTIAEPENFLVTVVLLVVAVAVAVLVDLAARRAQQASRATALAEADALRRALLSAVSHDLRTPLAAVKAASSSLRSTDVEFSAEDTAELIATIDESADQLTSLVENLLDSSRLQAGVVRPALAPVYVEDAVQRALIGLEADPSSTVTDVGSACVLADAGLLERVLANLVSNAVRHAPGSTVFIRATESGGETTITVADNGPGVTRAARQTMFDAFQRLGDTDNSAGVGLGLSVVRGFVEAMGGHVRALDTPGGGLTVAVQLMSPEPTVSSEPTVSPEPTVSSELRASGARPVPSQSSEGAQ